MSTSVARVEQSKEIAAPAPAELLRLAIEQKADPAYMRELMQLQRDWEANNARKAYVSAMAKFKAEPLTIVKDKHVSFATSKGKTEYDHATIGNVVEAIGARLAACGFSFRWQTDQLEGGRISVTCIITHELGHSESTTLKAGADDSGGKNNIQSIASTVTYLQRYTLLAATGMATRDQEDDDGATAEVEYITEKQEVTLREWIEAVGADFDKFLKYMKVERLAQIPAKHYEKAASALRAKEQAK
jgi:hypothetical protein